METYKRLRKRLPGDVATLALNFFKENFRRQGYINDAGVFIPWRKTKKKKGKVLGGSSSGILIGSGRLKRSLKKGFDFNTSRVSTDVPYAKIHNDGGEVNVTQNVKAHKRKIKGKYRAVKSHKRKLKYNMPRRPFLKHSKHLEREIEKTFVKQLKQIFR